MNENSFICIRINSWLSTVELRQHLFLSLAHTGQILQQLAPQSIGGLASTLSYHRLIQAKSFNSWSHPRMGPRQHLFLPLISYRPKFDQLTFSFFLREPRQHCSLSSAHTGQFFQQLVFFWSNGGPVSIHSYHWFRTDQILIFAAEITLRKQRYMEVFWWFLYRRIFSLIFFHELNLNFISFHFFLYSMRDNQFLIIFIDESELFGKVVISNKILKKFWKLLYLDNKSVIINYDCIRTINLNQ